MDIIERTRAAMKKGCRNSIIVSPTGSGKTVLTAHMLKTAASRTMGSAFLVHRRELLKQASTSFSAIGVNHGIVAAGFEESLKNLVQICSVPSLSRRLKRMSPPKLVLWDECHHLGAKTWASIHEALPDAYHVGLTATPQRTDGKGLGKWFQEIILGPSVGELIERRFLSPYKLFAPDGTVTDERVITGNAIREYSRLIPGKRAVVFAPSIEFSQRLVADFNEAGIRAVHVDGESDKSFRDGTLEDFIEGKIQILSNVALFGEGLDIPAIDAVIDLAPTSSLSAWLQRCGRALRPNKGKEMAYIIDHAGNAMLHGLPDDDRTWTLKGTGLEKKKSDIGPRVKICGQCFAAQENWRQVCKFCGYKFEIKSRTLTELDGDLMEVDLAIARNQRRREQGNADTLESLTELGESRGYKNPKGWAYHVLKARGKYG